MRIRSIWLVGALLFTGSIFSVNTAVAQVNNDIQEEAASDTTSADSTEQKSSYEKLLEDVDQVEKGFMNVYRVKKKLYLEIPFDAFGEEMLLGATISEISESDLGTVGARPNPPLHVVFTKVDSTVLLRKIAQNSIAPETYKALNQALADNSIGAILEKFDVKAFDEDTTKAVIDITNFMLSDNDDLSPFGSLGMNLPTGMKHSASFKKNRSFLGDFKAFEENISIKSHLSYDFNITLNDRPYLSEQPFTAVMTRTFMVLPENPARPRIADPRIGISSTEKQLFSDPANKTEEIYFARRFNLFPSDVAAYEDGELVEPETPIVFYVDEHFPESWKDPVKKGIEDWNKTFEKIGFKNAVVARDYPEDDPDFDPDNLAYNVIRYAPTTAQKVSAISWVDPRSGEILNASVYLYHNFLKSIDINRFVQTAAADPSARAIELPYSMKKEDMRYYVRRAMGYCLGFEANRASSSTIRVKSLRSPKFTQKYGLSYSVMDAATFNYVAQPGDLQKGVKMTPVQFGPYDYYIVKWNYTYYPEDKVSQAEEREKLENLVDKHMGDDKYLFRRSGHSIHDPTLFSNDLGNNAVEASEYGIKNLKYIMEHLNEWVGEEDKDFSYRREVWGGIAQQYIRYLNFSSSYIGGIYNNTKYVGDPRPRYESVSRDRQEEAFQFIGSEIKNLDWLMKDEVVKNFSLTADLPSVLREQLVQLLIQTPLRVHLSAKHSREKNPYTPEAAMEDLYEMVWAPTINHELPNNVEIELQKAFVGVTTKNSKLPVEGAGGGASAFAIDAQSQNYFVSVDGFRNMNEFDIQVNYEAQSRALATDGMVNFNLGPSMEDLSYKYLVEVQSLLEERVEETEDLNVKAHYQLLLHQLNKVLS